MPGRHAQWRSHDRKATARHPGVPVRARLRRRPASLPGREADCLLREERQLRGEQVRGEPPSRSLHRRGAPAAHLRRHRRRHAPVVPGRPHPGLRLQPPREEAAGPPPSPGRRRGPPAHRPGRRHLGSGLGPGREAPGGGLPPPERRGEGTATGEQGGPRGEAPPVQGAHHPPYQGGRRRVPLRHLLPPLPDRCRNRRGDPAHRRRDQRRFPGLLPRREDGALRLQPAPRTGAQPGQCRHLSGAGERRRPHAAHHRLRAQPGPVLLPGRQDRGLHRPLRRERGVVLEGHARLHRPGGGGRAHRRHPRPRADGRQLLDLRLPRGGERRGAPDLVRRRQVAPVPHERQRERLHLPGAGGRRQGGPDHPGRPRAGRTLRRQEPRADRAPGERPPEPGRGRGAGSVRERRPAGPDRPQPGVPGDLPDRRAGRGLDPQRGRNQGSGLDPEAPRIPGRGKVPRDPGDPRRAAHDVRPHLLPRDPAPGRPRLRGHVDQPAGEPGLRRGLHQGHPQGLGRGGLRGHDGRHRSPGRARLRGRGPDGGDRRLLRRLHDQLDRGAHRPVQGRGHPAERGEPLLLLRGERLRVRLRVGVHRPSVGRRRERARVPAHVAHPLREERQDPAPHHPQRGGSPLSGVPGRGTLHRSQGIEEGRGVRPLRG